MAVLEADVEARCPEVGHGVEVCGRFVVRALVYSLGFGVAGLGFRVLWFGVWGLG